MMRRRRAITLIELLVVIAIIGILMAILIPAVQAAREATRRMSCANNLRQIGLGLHVYHDSHGQFPPGGIALADCCSGPHLITWTIALLPYIDRQPLFDHYDHNMPNSHPANRAVVQTVVETYTCPSDIGTSHLEVPRSGPGKRQPWAPGSYRAVSGATTGVNGDWYFDNGSVPSSMPRSWRGALHVVRPDKGLYTEQMAGIHDGTSTSLIVGEYHTRSVGSRRTFWAYSYNSYNQSSVQKQRRTLVPDYRRCVSKGGPGGEDPCKRAFASFHSGGMNGLMADGHVVYLNLGAIDLNTWWAFGTIAGGDVAAP